jgi:hypothetical protein
MSGLINVDFNGDGNTVQRPAWLACGALLVQRGGTFHSAVAEVYHYRVKVWVDLAHAGNRGLYSGLGAHIARLRGCSYFTGAFLPKGGACHLKSPDDNASDL